MVNQSGACWKLCWHFLVALMWLSEGHGYRSEERCNRGKRDLIIIMDGTITVGHVGFDMQKTFVASILSKMEFGPGATQVGIIQFSDKWNTKVEMDVGEHQIWQDIRNNLSRIPFSYGRRTFTGLAMKMAREQLFSGKTKARPGADKTILLITDGKSVDSHVLEKEVGYLKGRHVRIVTIAVGHREKQIATHRYATRAMADSFRDSFKATFTQLAYLVENVADAICRFTKAPSPSGEPRGKPELQQKCFQEKKDIFFAMDGSSNVDEKIFRKAVSFISRICGDLDITPSLIHVGMMQYSDALNTRIEFGLNQYTRYYQVNESLQNIFQSKGKESDLDHALSIIDKEIFNGESGDRISAEDFLLLFVNDIPDRRADVSGQIQRLKDKGVHVIIIGLGSPTEETESYYEELASNPSDRYFFESVKFEHVIGDLTAITCRRVSCEEKKAEDEKNKAAKRTTCEQQPEDILFMIDMTYDVTKAIKFFTKVVKKLNIAASNTHVGVFQFSSSYVHLRFPPGKYKFEKDLNRELLRIRKPRYRRVSRIGRALREVNRKVFNRSTGGHRENIKDLIVIATRGSTVNRREVQREAQKLKAKGVTIAVLDVGFKKQVLQHQNVIHDLASGPREIYPLDFRRVSSTAQSLMDIQCKVEEERVSPECFTRRRQVLFMLDSSRGLSDKHLRQVLRFIERITRELYTKPNNIAVGLLQYSDPRTASYALWLQRRPLKETVRGIRFLRYRQGRKNYLGSAWAAVNRVFQRRLWRKKEDHVIILVAHSPPADPQKAFTMSEKMRENGVKIITVVVHTQKTPMKLNAQYKALSSSRASAQSFDVKNIVKHSHDLVMNLCELNGCPEDSTKRCTPLKQDIFMIIDSSRSIGNRVYPQLKRFVRRLVTKLDVAEDRTHVGILQASSYRQTQYEMKLGEFKKPEEIKSVISEMGYHGGRTSYIGKGLQLAVRDNLFNVSMKRTAKTYGTNIDRSDAENVLMLYTDGVFHDEYLARKLIENLKAHGVRVVVVGLGKHSRRPRAKSLLESVASSRPDVYLVDLNKASLLMEEELNEVAQHVATLECKNLYQPPPQCSPESLDLFFIIDGSLSMGWANFAKVKAFVKKMVNEFEIGRDKVHLGLMQFGKKTDTRIEFNLNDYYSNKEVEEAINEILPLDSLRTETGHALSIVNKKIFNGKGVDRPNVPNILILVTDGSAHDMKVAKREANELKQRGTRIIGIGAGRSADSFFDQLKEIASNEKDAHKSEFDQLSGIVDDLLDVVCE